jgi:hypothetical protein
MDAEAVMDRALEAAAEPWMRGHLVRAYAVWAYANQQCYGGRLSTPFIEISLPHEAATRAGHAWADVGPGDGHGTRLHVRLHPGLLHGDPDHHRSADPSVLHEQVHAEQHEVLGWPWDTALDWHGPAFRRRLAEVEATISLYLPLLRSS